MDTQAELEEVQKQIRNKGSYPAIVTPDELRNLSDEEGAVDRRFSQEMTPLAGPLDGHGRREAQGRPDPVHPQWR